MLLEQYNTEAKATWIVNKKNQILLFTNCKNSLSTLEAHLAEWANVDRNRFVFSNWVNLPIANFFKSLIKIMIRN